MWLFACGGNIILGITQNYLIMQSPPRTPYFKNQKNSRQERLILHGTHFFWTHNSSILHITNSPGSKHLDTTSCLWRLLMKKQNGQFWGVLLLPLPQTVGQLKLTMVHHPLDPEGHAPIGGPCYWQKHKAVKPATHCRTRNTSQNLVMICSEFIITSEQI